MEKPLDGIVYDRGLRKPPPGVVATRVQNLVITLDKIKYVLRQEGQCREPFLRTIGEEEIIEHLWDGNERNPATSRGRLRGRGEPGGGNRPNRRAARVVTDEAKTARSSRRTAAERTRARVCRRLRRCWRTFGVCWRPDRRRRRRPGRVSRLPRGAFARWGGGARRVGGRASPVRADGDVGDAGGTRRSSPSPSSSCRCPRTTSGRAARDFLLPSPRAGQTPATRVRPGAGASDDQTEGEARAGVQGGPGERDEEEVSAALHGGPDGVVVQADPVYFIPASLSADRRGTMSLPDPESAYAGKPGVYGKSERKAMLRAQPRQGGGQAVADDVAVEFSQPWKGVRLALA